MLGEGIRRRVVFIGPGEKRWGIWKWRIRGERRGYVGSIGDTGKS